LALGLDLVTLLGAGAGDLLFRVAARSDRPVVVLLLAVAAGTLVEESREEREEEVLELEREPEPEVLLAAFFVAVFLVDLAVLAVVLLGAAFLVADFFLVAAAFVFFTAAVFFLVTQAAFVCGPGAFSVAGGVGGGLDWIYCTR
jgi:hypothetical protein